MAWPLKNLINSTLGKNRGIACTQLYQNFHTILERNNQIFELMADMGDKLGGEYVFGNRYLEEITLEIEEKVAEQIADFNNFTNRKNEQLVKVYERISQSIETVLSGGYMEPEGGLVVPLDDLSEDASQLVGAKMAGIAHLRNRLLVPTGDGFVITIRAYVEFMQRNRLLEEAVGLFRDRGMTDESILQAKAETLQQRILRAELPRSLVREIKVHFDELAERRGKTDLRVSLRSSGWGEDGENSFAGQYITLLNVSRDNLIDGYRRVVASAYAPGAWRYRLHKGYHENEIVIAVGCQETSAGFVSGVLHTYAPHIDAECMVVNAAWGLCEPIVRGELAADTYFVQRIPPHVVRRAEIASKAHRLVPAAGEGVVLEDMPAEQINRPCLAIAELEKLAEAAVRIEQYYKCPQEIEWTFDKQQNLRIIQVRPIRFRGTRYSPGCQLEETINKAEIIFGHKGFTVQCGIGVGKIYTVRNDEDLEDFPQGAILLTQYSSPRYASIMHKARGIITDVGSPTGHMATLAREYRVPTIVNTGVATSLLRDGDEVTLDATQATVYRGYLYALDRFQLTEEVVFEDTYEYRLLRRLQKHVGHLNLVNSQSDDFSPRACKTYHDILRYVHVRAVETFIRLSEQNQGGDLSPPRRLEAEIPLGLLVVDGGRGTKGPFANGTITPEQIVSVPLRALIAGMEELGMWCTIPVSVDLSSFMASFTRTFCAYLASPQEVGRNLAVVSYDYMDVNLRLGYHFTCIDAKVSEDVDDNYINFRFLGGVTEFVRRSRRAVFIANVLEYFDFLVEVHGDFVLGRLKKLGLKRMTERMRMLGGLVGYTRQLDACMHSDADISYHTEIFLKAIKNTFGG
jgi:pyruvate,water dikinase